MLSEVDVNGQGKEKGAFMVIYILYPGLGEDMSEKMSPMANSAMKAIGLETWVSWPFGERATAECFQAYPPPFWDI